MIKLLKYKEYSPRTSEIYDQLFSVLKKLLPDSRVEHIGSSAVVGSLSKGDLDILVAVEQNEFDKTLKVIKSIGFVEKEGTLRTNELCMLITDKYNYDVAIQLIIEGSEFEDFARFRDILNSNPYLVEEYNQIKLQFFDTKPDIYREKKSIFIKKTLDTY